MTRRLPTIVLLVAALAALPAPAVAQGDDAPGVLTWIAYSTVRSGMLEDAVAMNLEDRDLMDGLVEDGTILGWGMGTPINHSHDDTWNFVQWVHLENWAKADAWVAASMERMNAMTPEETAAQQARFEEIFVEGSHFDEVVRHDVQQFGSREVDPRYLYVGEFAARPGKSGALVDLFEASVVPTLEALVADGTLTGYGVYSPELHLDVDWTHRFWYALPDLGAMDPMLAAFRDATTPGFAAQAEDVFEPRGHYDKVVLILHLSR